jgi:hypothetical protein
LRDVPEALQGHPNEKGRPAGSGRGFQMKKTLQKLAVGFVLAVFLSLLLTCGAELSHGSTSNHSNSLGIVISHTNPNTSVVGTILDGAIVADKDGREGTVLRIHPLGMYGLYDESITFCGDQTGAVSRPDGRILPGDLVFIYRRQAARLIDNVPCFELKSVSRIAPDKKRFK